MVYEDLKCDTIKCGSCLIKGAYYEDEIFCCECLNKKAPHAL